ncbi:MAG: GumC family protein [Bryobacteraceae bacterium]
MPESKSSVPAVIESRAKLAPVYVSPLGNIGRQHSTPAAPLLRCLSAVKRQCWKILFFVTVAALVTFIGSKRLTPVYESTATIDVDRQPPQGIIGQESQRRSLDDTEKFLATQLRLIQSDSVLRPVALKYHLLDEAQQYRSVSKWTALARAEAPVILKQLKVARLPNTYLLQIRYRSSDPHRAAYVANAIAASYIEHTYDMRIRSSTDFSSFLEKQLHAVKARVEKSSLALATFERDSKIVNPDENADILSERLLKLSRQLANAQADRMAKEARYNAAKTGSLEGSEFSGQSPAFKSLSKRLDEANERFSNVKAEFGADRPEYRRAAGLVTQLTKRMDRLRRSLVKRLESQSLQAASRERVLGVQVAGTKAELDKIKAGSSKYKSLQLEAETEKTKYEEVLQKIREPGLSGGFQNNSIRLADSARPAFEPVSPNIRLNVVLACLFASLLAMIVAIVSDLFDHTFRDPEQARRILNADIIGMLPIARSRSTLLSSGKDKSGVLMPSRGANDKRTAAYVEAMRTLRNSIAACSMDRRLKSILMTSTAAREGKSTTAVHLALAHAAQRRRTLLIDCDLRTSSIHRYFDVSNSVGVTNVIMEGMPWREAVARVDETPELHLLLAGPLGRTGPDLVGREIASIIAEAEREYDLVVVDAPPIFGFAEPLQIARHVGGVMVVTAAGQTNRHAVAALLNMMSRLRIQVTGIVLNKVAATANNGSYHYGYGRVNP